ncbi:hypothetical protein PSN45_000926 [Yamadazyma tenuis]|uniref:Conserved oligomeric Golgi complex subunit 2 n=1 Tax=Candida tenuis (strain ATCC 10573 / BCRC 21748 / CBS 615 / JCM 9827 / NBRC 10315 / NRRL Y-1498 / VKM Y-70) TaxID=590646 RepID=G3BBP8_CANTC|nr:uncharacterized protein CANTEDRAFT_115666 [Yamadazyma tenuis ATCC 10573]EGV62206.1 hypothetical protein CANTEDRAFT_115666 [Yamadazyma tenuis ATCC 10573]WEJ93463.1 hypothetical protein PSN45_000926 [Yamadazyma tenuis]
MSLDLDIDEFSNKNLRDLINEPSFDVDPFLHKNYRFESIDLLTKELAVLHSQLNQELIHLINNNFDQFIKLSLSLDGSAELINSISVDLNNFNLKLQAVIFKFNKVNGQFNQVLQFQTDLNRVKFKINAVLLTNKLISNLDGLLVLGSTGSPNPKQSVQLAKNMLNLSLNINNLQLITNHGLVNLKKFKSLLLELRSFLGSLKNLDSEDKFELFKVRKILDSINP